jgi:hypothetical protein
MATRFSKALPSDLRYEPMPKRVRADAGGGHLGGGGSGARQGPHETSDT